MSFTGVLTKGCVHAKRKFTLTFSIGFITMWRNKLHPILLVATISLFVTAGIFTNLVTQEQQGARIIQNIHTQNSHDGGEEVCLTRACVLAASTLLNNMDESVDPCDNFYKFSCGNFEANTVVPPGVTMTSSLAQISDKLDQQIWRIINQPVIDSEPKVFKLVKNFYQSCMDISEIESKGEQPLLQVLKQLGGWPVVDGDSWNESDFSWTNTTYRMRQLGYLSNYLIDMTPLLDKKNSSRRILTVDQPTLGLERQYLNSLKGMDEPNVREYWKFSRYVAFFLGANMTRALREMHEVIKFEMKLAKLSATATIDDPITIGELQSKWPNVPWLEFINNLLPGKLKYDENDLIIMNAPEYFNGFGEVMKETDKRTQANYLIWRIVSASLDCLSEPLRKLQLDFTSKTTGPEQREPRWKECTVIVRESLAVAVGALYIRHYFKEEYKQDVTEMVENLKTAFLGMLEQVDWMDDITKNRAIEKLKTMYVHVGYPIELLNDTLLEEFYDGLELSSTGFLGNYLNLSKFSSNQAYSSLLSSINKTDWRTHGNSAVVNAFYGFHENSVEFPAGILQGMFYGHGRPNYMNYGAIGMAIGHEISHGFDEKGGQYDINGNINNWWEDSTMKAFLERTQCMVAQYGNYSVPEVGMDLNGKTTKNENIADNGGMKEAYNAYQAWVKRNNKLEPRLPGLNAYTPNQLFWISSASAWCSKYTKEHLTLRVSVGDHPPSEFRINGALSNLPIFAEEFNCTSGRKMNPINKCSLW